MNVEPAAPAKRDRTTLRAQLNGGTEEEYLPKLEQCFEVVHVDERRRQVEIHLRACRPGSTARMV